MEAEAKRVPHFGLRKLSVGVASVLLSTTLYFGVTAHAATNVPEGSSSGVSQDTHTSSPYSASKVKLGSVAGTVDGNVNSASVVNENVNKAGNDSVGSVVNNSVSVNGNGSASSSVDSTVNNSVNVNGNGSANSSVGSTVDASAGSSANGSANKTVDNSVNSSANNSPSASVNDVANDNLVTTTFNTLMDHSSRIDPSMLMQSLRLTEVFKKVPYQDGTAGVNDAFNRYVSRTVNITLPDGTKKDPITQTVHFVRKDAHGNAGTRNNDGTVSFVPWTVADSPSERLGHFAAVNLPKLAGYAAVDKLSSSEVDSVNSQVVAQVVLPYMVNSTVNVEYKALGTNMPVYVIDDNLGDDAVIIDASVSGTPGQQVPLNIKLPGGYQLKAGQTIPTTVTIDPNNTTPLRIHVTEKVVTVTHDHPVNNGNVVPNTNNEIEYISGMSQSDLNHTVTRKVIVSKPDGTSQTIDGGSVTFIRDAEYNLVTGQVTYTSWSNDGKKTLPAVAVDDVPGYVTHRDQAAGDLVVTPYNQQVTGKVTFVPINEATTIRFIDVEDNGSDGEPMEVGSYQINGETGTSFIQTSDDLQQALTDSGLDAYFVLDDPTAMVSGTYGPDKEYNVKLKHRHVILSHNNLNRGTWTLPDGEPVPSNVGESSVYKTIRRTINVEVPSVDGQGIIREPDPIDQVATFAQDIDVDMGKLYNNVDPNDAMTYEGWNLNSAAGSDHFASYTPPVINGYTPSVSSVPAEVVTQDSNADDVINITYTASDQTGKISYVDAIGGEEVGHTDLTGKTNEAVTIKPVAPTGWKISDGQNIPSKVIATANGVPTVTVKVEHIITPVSHNNPIPAGSKTTTGVEINGAHDSDLNQTITRTINVTDPSGHKTTTTQEAKISQDAKYDEVTGEVTYDGNWSQDSTHWSEVDVPAVDGYAPSVATVPALTVKHGQQNVTIDIDYTANSHSTKINFIDNQGHVINSVTVDGKTGETKQLGSGYHADVPTGWALDGSEIPTEIVFGSDGHADYNLNVKHAIHHVTHDQAVPADGETVTGAKVQGAHESDLNKTIVRTITETAPDGHTVAHAIRTQTAHLYRDADYDEVTGEVSYGNWSKDDTNWAAVTPDAIDGYTTDIDGVPGTTVPAVSVDGNQLPVTVKVTYSADHHVMHIFFEDDNGDKITPDGLGTNYPGIEVSGNTDTTARLGTDYEAPVPTGWELEADQQVPKEVSFGANGHGDVVVKIKHHLVHFTHDQPVADGTTTSTGQSVDGAFTDDLNQTIVRTITTTGPVNHPVAQPKIVQKAQLFQDGYYDDVTGEVTTNDWSQATWDAVTPEAIPGYTAHIKINGQEASSIPRVVVKNGQQDVDVEVTYTADTHTMHINFEDDQDNKISSVEVTGDTDETKTNGTDYHANVPTGWVLESGQSIPASVTFGANGHADVTVKIKHGTINFTHDKPVPEGTKTPTGTPVDGGHESDLNQTITRMITETAPAGHPVAHSNITQTAHLYRNGSYDTVTGHVTYDNWSEDSSNWTAVTPDAIDGYTAHIMTDGRTTGDIPAVTVRDGQKPVTVNISYTANDQTMTIHYVNEYGTTVQDYQVSGRTDQTVDTNAPIPAGWELLGGQTPAPAAITFKRTKTDDITVKIKHRKVSVTADKPVPDGKKNDAGKLIDGAHENDLNQTITRTIKVTDPHSGKVTTTMQTAKISRNATYDDVTGEVTTDAWSQATWDAVTPETVPGYTAHIMTDGRTTDDIPAVTVVNGQKDVNVEVTYTADDHSMHIYYQDQAGHNITPDGRGADGTGITVSGKTGQIVDTHAAIPTGWVLASGQQDAPAQVIFGADGHADIIIKIEHGTKAFTHQDPIPDNGRTPTDQPIDGGHESDLNQTITRTITETAPAGHTVAHSSTTQTAKIFRDGSYDTVTGHVTYGNWSEDSSDWTAVTPDVIDGYTTHIKVDGQDADNISAVTVKDGQKDVNVEVIYTANDQQTTVDYVINGHTIKQETLSGVTDSQVPVNISLPDGYSEVAGQTIPKTYTFKAKNNQPVVVQLVKNQELTINYIDLQAHNQVKTQTVDGVTGQIVNMPSVELPAGYRLAEGQDIPKTFTLNDTGNNSLDIVVMPILVRVTADQPKASGTEIPDANGAEFPEGLTQSDLNKTITRTIKVNYPDNRIDTVDQTVHFVRDAVVNAATGDVAYGAWQVSGKDSFEAYTPKIVDGFKANTVASQVVTADTKDSMVQVIYTQIPQAKAPLFVDASGVGYDKVPAGYHVADGQLVSKGSQLIVKDVHVTVPPVTIVTRTINMTMPNGKTLKIVQKAVKGSSNFSAVRLPHLRGYQLKIDGQAATNFLIASAQADGNVTINVVFSK